MLNQDSKKIIVVACLDWGLGHASRSIPLIEALLQRNCQIILASNDRALLLLQEEFPELESITLPPYNIKYPSQNMSWNMALQIPKLIRAILLEYYCLKRILRQRHIDAVISDSRFGFFNKKVFSVFISHQINLNPPSALIRAAGNLVNHFFISRYQQVWIPDLPQWPGIAGRLSHPAPSHAQYLGLLSRMEKFRKTSSIRYQVLLLLSGPEPQRSIFEEIVIRQAIDQKGAILVVQGKTEQFTRRFPAKNIEIVSYLNSRQVSEAISSSEVIICRSGYSTLMDLFALRRRAVLIPTPGQYEQEYLASLASKKGWPTMQQGSFNLVQAIEMGKKKGADEIPTSLLSQVIERFLADL